MPTGFGRAHGMRSRTNTSHTGGNEHKRQALDSYKDSPRGGCWGCQNHKREPWEHEPGRCPHWFVRTMDCSGT